MIKFPKLHIAQSVTNRILNVAHDIEARTASLQPPTVPSTPPPVPDPGPIGDAVAGALAQPTAPVAADPALAQAVVADAVL